MKMDLIKAIVSIVKEIKDKRKLWLIYDFVKHLKEDKRTLD